MAPNARMKGVVNVLLDRRCPTRRLRVAFRSGTSTSMGIPAFHSKVLSKGPARVAHTLLLEDPFTNSLKSTSFVLLYASTQKKKP
jgi:hypothetical protein